MSMGGTPLQPRRRVDGGTGPTGTGPACAPLDPDLLRIIEALAEARARADYGARYPIQEDAA